MRELRTYYERFTKARIKRERVKQASVSLTTVLDLLPGRAICDKSVRSYFRSFEKCMGILHYPSFMDEYQRFWESGETQRQTFTSFVPQLAAIVALLYAWENASASENENIIKSDGLCSHVEACLDSSTGRKQLILETLRTRALLVLAKQVRVVPVDEIWNATGKLLRSAMMAGLHRNPLEFTNISIFEKELRRRLWMTIVEMELEASLIYGMPVMLPKGSFTCNAPSNLDDVDLFDGMTSLPESKALEESSDSAFQAALVGSLSLRLQAVNEPTARTENAHAHIQSLENYVQNLPSKFRLDENMKKDSEETFAVVMLNVYIRRIVSFLCRSSGSFTELGPKTDPQSSLSILSYGQFFDPDNLGSDRSQSSKYWDLFYILCKSDVMQAALDVSLYVLVPGLVSWTKASLLLAIDDTIASLMRRISRNGSDIKDILRLAATCQLLKAQFMQANSEVMMKEAAHSVLTACRRAIGQEVLNNKGVENEMVWLRQLSIRIRPD